MVTCNQLNTRGSLQQFFITSRLLMIHCIVGTDLLYNLRVKRILWYAYVVNCVCAAFDFEVIHAKKGKKC